MGDQTKAKQEVINKTRDVITNLMHMALGAHDAHIKSD
jgi:hypothetical protein